MTKDASAARLKSDLQGRLEPVLNDSRSEATTGFEPVMGVLQTLARNFAHSV